MILISFFFVIIQPFFAQETKNLFRDEVSGKDLYSDL